MSRVFKDLQIPIEQDLEEKLALLVPDFSSYRILRQSVDARRSRDPHFVYAVEVFEKDEKARNEKITLERIPTPNEKPIIIGAGPAGLFAALRLIERGVKCQLFERGSAADQRMKGINRFWRYGELDARNNVCFGEGGAGLYSDGKLITRIKSPHIPYVMDRLIRFGAPEEIRYLANPHVGSDRIRRVIPLMRQFLLQNGCEIHFDTQVTELLFQGQQVTGVRTERNDEFYAPHVILATGHSAQDMIDTLYSQGVAIDGKSFALGLRIEHPQKVVNQIQYRSYAEHPKLGAANYKLTSHDKKTGTGVYSFCMCPGGYVLSSGTEPDGIVCNGMSNYHRNSPFANAAIVISVDHQKLFGQQVFGGMQFRREIEINAKRMVEASGAKKEIPAQTVFDFINGRAGSVLKSSSPSGVAPARLDQLLPSWMVEKLKSTLEEFDQHMKGFLHKDAQFHGVESRTSCPIRITRDPDTLESISHKGFYPTGEGAGYAGGITSAACDGIRVAEKIIDQLNSIVGNKSANSALNKSI